MINGYMDTGDTKGFRYFSNNQWCLFLFILIIGISLRWVSLSSRPFHHDESLHAFLGYYFAQTPDHNYYKYNPMLHGPVLYHLMRWTYELLPFSKFSSRFPLAVIGSILLFVPLLFRKFFTPYAVIALTAMMATSTTMIYWSRFLSHDLLMVLWWVLAAYGILLSKRRFRLCIVCTALTLQFCTKENAFVTVAIILGFFIFEYVYRQLVQRYLMDTAFAQACLFRRAVQSFRDHPLQVILVGVICFTLFIYFFSGSFRFFGEDNVRGPGVIFSFISDIITSSVGYWWHQHRIERIPGPFSYMIFLISWYDFIIIFLFFCHLVFIGIQSKGFFRVGFITLLGACGLIAVVCLSYSPEDFQQVWIIDSQFGNFLKVKNGIDVVCFCFLVLYAPFLALYHLARNETGLAFAGYFFLANLFTYSYLGEKVPWLAIYPLLSGCVYLTLCFDPLFCRPCPITHENKGSFLHKRCFAHGYWPLVIVLLLVYNIYTIFLVMFAHSGVSGELISQNHTTGEFDQTILRIRSQMDSQKNSPAQFLVTGKAIWPSSTYMLGNKNYHFVAKGKEDKRFDWIIADTAAEIDLIRKDYVKRQLSLRVSAKIDFNHIGLVDYFHYLTCHRSRVSPRVTWVWIGCRTQDSICTTLPELHESNTD